MSKIEAYRTAMLARKAAKAGISVEELLRRGEAEADRNYQIFLLRRDRELQFKAIGRKAAAHGRIWEIL